MNSRILGVAIGLGTIFLFYSLAVTQVNEWLAGLLSWRAKFLANGIKDKLLDGKLGEELLQHPLIASMGFNKKGLPSYIPGTTFARALLDVIAREGSARPGASWADTIDQEKIAGVVGTRLATVIKNDAMKTHDAEIKLAHWFDDSMDRMSGAYKRRARLWSFVIGTALVGATNADTLVMAARFWSDPVAREAEVAAAQKFVAQCAKNERGELECPKVPAEIRASIESEIPMKWSRAEWRGVSGVLGWSGWLWWVLLKVIGLVMSALAVSLGAPFWFDLLQKIAPSFRSAGTPPQRASAMAIPPAGASGAPPVGPVASVPSVVADDRTVAIEAAAMGGEGTQTQGP
jgi:hypothetical protein